MINLANELGPNLVCWVFNVIPTTTACSIAGHPTAPKCSRSDYDASSASWAKKQTRFERANCWQKDHNMQANNNTKK